MLQHALVASNAFTLGKRIASGSSGGTYVQEILTNLFHGEKKKMSPWLSFYFVSIVNKTTGKHNIRKGNSQKAIVEKNQST